MSRARTKQAAPPKPQQQTIMDREAARVFRALMADVTAYTLAPRPGLFLAYAPEAVAAAPLRRFIQQAALLYDDIQAACR